MKLGHLEVFVAEPVASRDWYVRVLGAESVADQGDFQWIKLGDVELLFRKGQPRAASTYRESAIALVLYIQDLSGFSKRLSEQGCIVTHGDADDCLTFQDPDGHWIQATCPD
jgi:catechol 2,3-dioxygenase-like lactoylglutathione lyase family enzyme